MTQRPLVKRALRFLAVPLLVLASLGAAVFFGDRYYSMRDQVHAQEQMRVRFCTTMRNQLSLYADIMGDDADAGLTAIAGAKDYLQESIGYCLKAGGADPAEVDRELSQFGLTVSSRARDKAKQKLDQMIARLRSAGY